MSYNTTTVATHEVPKFLNTKGKWDVRETVTRFQAFTVHQPCV